jgi:hypothetical protein
LSISSFLEEKYGIESGALCMRFGKPYFNGGTVDHLHAQLIAPDPENENLYSSGLTRKANVKKKALVLIGRGPFDFDHFNAFFREDFLRVQP